MFFIIVESNISLFCLLVGVLVSPTSIVCGESLVYEFLYLFELKRSVMHSWLIKFLGFLFENLNMKSECETYFK